MSATPPENPAPNGRREEPYVEPVRRWGRALARAMIVFFVIVCVIAVKFGEHLESNTNKANTGIANANHALVIAEGAIHQLEERQYLGCHRTNIERRQSNIQNFADYQFFSFTLTVIGTAARHPAKPPTPTERKITMSFLDGLRNDVAKKAYVPLTFCRGPVTLIYHPPKPVSFAAVHGKPPKSAFKLQKGQ